LSLTGVDGGQELEQLLHLDIDVVICPHKPGGLVAEVVPHPGQHHEGLVLWRIRVVLDIIQHHHGETRTEVQRQRFFVLGLSNKEPNISTKVNHILTPGSPNTTGSGGKVAPCCHNSDEYWKCRISMRRKNSSIVTVNVRRLNM